MLLCSVLAVFMEMSCSMLTFETKGTCGNSQRVGFEYIYD